MAQDFDNGNLMYLPKDFWSPRYESNFYTVKIEGKRHVSFLKTLGEQGKENEKSVEPCPSLGGKTNLPAYYYEVVVYRQHTKKSVFRRYSQFKWMHDQLMANPPVDEGHEQSQADAGPIKLPPGTCPFQWQDDEFAQNRLEELSDYITEILARPGYAKHPAVVAFLAL